MLCMLNFWSKKDTITSLSISIIRKTWIRRMSLRVEPGGAIVVRAPKRVSERAIQQFVLGQQEWIQKQKTKMHHLVPLTTDELLWYRKQAREYLPKRVLELAQKHGFKYTSVTCRHQQTRWGSCSSKNTLSLNIELMRLPKELQDYILLHELTHTLHKHHKASFWHHLDVVLPWSLELDRKMREWRIGYKNISQ